MHSEQPLLSVVVPAFNEAERLPESLSRIRHAFSANPTLPYELIVCDNNSTDATADLARRAGCRVVFEPVNQISRARNRGAGAATGVWLLFIDADSWPPPELIRDIVPLLADRRCIGAGSTIRVVDGPRWFRFVWESKNWSMRTFRWCPGGFILCRRDAFFEIDGFSDEHYLFEEVDFVRRLKTTGKRRDQRFVILHKNPFCTSGRRAESYGIGAWLRFGVRLTLFHGHAVRDKQFAEKWYRRSWRRKSGVDLPIDKK